MRPPAVTVSSGLACRALPNLAWHALWPANALSDPNSDTSRNQMAHSTPGNLRHCASPSKFSGLAFRLAIFCTTVHLCSMYKSTMLLLPLLVSGYACDSTKSFEQVTITGLKQCDGGIYQQPLMIRLSGKDSEGRYTISNGDDTITMRKDKKTTYRVRVGVCQNPIDESPTYQCTEPTEWYSDQKFTYDSKSPKMLAVPAPPLGQTCLKL